MARDIRVVGILVEKRAAHAPEVQEVLTRYGSRILMRCGIPDPGRERGIITLTMQAEENEYTVMENDLQKIDGVSVKSVSLAEAIG
ncbi:MAG: TM1266 family iron-only hydrogenase system putative regulator [Bacillota bacterium]